MRNQMIKLATMGKECNIGLGLGIGGHGDYCISKKSSPIQFHMLFPPKSEQEDEEEEEEEEEKLEKPTKRSKKKKKNINKEEQEDMVDQDKGGGTNYKKKKKLKLTKEQTTSLEDSFKENYTLNMTQKQELANKLQLNPRQIEVWFQNRRARNKSKQTEVDLEMLRKWCKRLSDENRRLKVELQELRKEVVGGEV